MKKDRTEYIRAADVMQIYASVIKQGQLPRRAGAATSLSSYNDRALCRTVNKLNEIRDEHGSSSGDNEPSTSALPTPDQANRVDTTLMDVFQLLSLFFLTIGKSRESPATFCQLATMKVRLALKPCEPFGRRADWSSPPRRDCSTT